MKRRIGIYIVSGILLFFPSIMLSQTSLKEATKEDFRTYQNLSRYLSKPYSKNEKKTYAIYHWITHFIELDSKALTNTWPLHRPSPEEVYMQGKTTNEGFAILMKAMLLEVGIESELVRGYTRIYPCDSILLPVFDNHMWVAIYLNDKWQLCDPALDAGYIGHKRTNKISRVSKMQLKFKKKYQRKIHKFEIQKNSNRSGEFKELSLKREEKTKEHFANKRMAMEDKIDRLPDYKNQIIFHRFTQNKYFLIDPDSFLMSHLPVYPMWQLREDTLNIELYIQGKQPLSDFIKHPKSGSYDFTVEIENYRFYSPFGKELKEAEIGFEANNQNARILAEVSYNTLYPFFNYLGSQIPPTFELNNDLNRSTLSIIDSAMKYTMIAEKSTSTYFKYLNGFYRNQSKEIFKAIDDQTFMIEKSEQWNEAAFEDIIHSKELIDRNLENWKKIKNKLSPSPQKPFNPDSFDLKVAAALIPQEVDSFIKLYEEVKHLREIWIDKLNNSALNKIKSLQKSLHNHLRDDILYLRLRTFNTNEIMLKNQLLIEDAFEQIQGLYEVSLKEELFCKDYENSLSQFYKNVKIITSQLRQSENHLNRKENRFSCSVLEGYLNVFIDRFLNDLNDARLHYEWLNSELKKAKDQWGHLNNACKRELELNNEKTKYHTESMEIHRQREENSILEMKNNFKIWEDKMDKPIVEKLELKHNSNSLHSRAIFN